jgi:class 3 adenylate cyclase
MVADWERQKIPAHIIPVAPAGTGAPGLESSPATATEEKPLPVQQEIKAMLLAEVVNFPRIAEAQMPAFVEHFKGAIARELVGRAPAAVESWAGIHYFVYDSPETAGLFALAVRDQIGRTDWKQYGLPENLGVRMVLHAGPVFAFVDPALQRTTYIGSHVNRAARIEPITPRGEIYCTQEFAALCGADGVSSVSFEYLGYLRTTTMFEDAALYRLDRAPEKNPAEQTGSTPPTATPARA